MEDDIYQPDSPLLVPMVEISDELIQTLSDTVRNAFEAAARKYNAYGRKIVNRRTYLLSFKTSADYVAFVKACPWVLR